jgi:hypothetical protein
MKFICLGCMAEKNWEALSKNEQDALIEECFAYDGELLKSRQWIDGGQALQSTRTAKTLRWKNGKVLVTDGPFAETKEQLGGVVVNRFKDMNHAIELLRAHPALRFGVTIEIRPIDEEMNARWEARQDRFRAAAS